MAFILFRTLVWRNLGNARNFTIDIPVRMI